MGAVESRTRGLSAPMTWSVLSIASLLLLAGCAAPTPPAALPVPSNAATATSAPSPPATAKSSPSQLAGSALPGSALAALLQLAVRNEMNADSYQRDAFGEPWLDVDRNGCDTRNDMLTRDLVDAVISADCLVRSGTLVSAYTGATVPFVRGAGTSTRVQIDHVVALADAWRTGAFALSAAQRVLLANDPLNLQSIEGPLNGQKSDQDAAEWLPPLVSYRCTYVARQISVKWTYGLWVTPSERDAMATVLASCPNQPLLASSLSGVIPPVTAANTTPEAPPPAAEDGVGAVTYANCAAARAAGAAPIRIGEPGYATRLDRDGDGVACE